jgi:hypothetical protein
MKKTSAYAGQYFLPAGAAVDTVAAQAVAKCTMDTHSLTETQLRESLTSIFPAEDR